MLRRLGLALIVLLVLAAAGSLQQPAKIPQCNPPNAAGVITCPILGQSEYAKGATYDCNYQPMCSGGYKMEAGMQCLGAVVCAPIRR